VAPLAHFSFQENDGAAVVAANPVFRAAGGSPSVEKVEILGVEIKAGRAVASARIGGVWIAGHFLQGPFLYRGGGILVEDEFHFGCGGGVVHEVLRPFLGVAAILAVPRTSKDESVPEIHSPSRPQTDFKFSASRARRLAQTIASVLRVSGVVFAAIESLTGLPIAGPSARAAQTSPRMSIVWPAALNT
jgi:hypothetical protein